ncbi:cytochrome P450 709B2-like [Wolffia australiana]
MEWWVAAAVAAAVVAAVWAAVKAAVAVVWRPAAVARSFAEQGVRGPPYRLLWGCLGEMKALDAAASAGPDLDISSHDIAPKILPFYHRWQLQYGGTFLYWAGTQPRLFVTEPEAVKQVLTEFSVFPKEEVRPSVAALLGRGLVLAEGRLWRRHRRLLSPAFAAAKLRPQLPAMAACAAAMLDRWAAELGGAAQAEIEVDSHFLRLTGDIIARAAFGLGPPDAELVFHAQSELQRFAFSSTLDLPFPAARFLPTPGNLRLWRQERRLRRLLQGIIRRRMAGGAAGHGEDLLGVMLDATPSLSMDEMVDECKTFFFAGHETTAHLLTWTVFLLATHPDWQRGLRAEAAAVCGAAAPGAEELGRLREAGMVLLEAARLYSPVAVLPVRRAAAAATLGGLRVAAGTAVTVAPAVVQRSAAAWGADAGEFRPERFLEGGAGGGLVAFSVGARACVGREFAMAEAKVALAMMLRRFSWGLSPKYRHSPQRYVTLRPRFGLPVLLRPL